MTFFQKIGDRRESARLPLVGRLQPIRRQTAALEDRLRVTPQRRTKSLNCMIVGHSFALT
jgi:hypothetical protein